MNNKNYKRGQIIFKENDPSVCMYDIASGLVGIYNAYGTPEEELIAELSYGEILGETGFLESIPRTATAVALDDNTDLKVITENDLKEYFLSDPEKLLLIMRNLSERLREMNSKLAEVCKTIYES